MLAGGPYSSIDAKEYGHDVIAGDGLMGGAGEQVAGVVIEPVQDLDVGPVREAPVDEVRLPHLVRLRHLKARVGATGGVCAARGVISPASMQDPADRRRRRRSEPLPLEVPADRDRPGVQPVSGQPSRAARSPARRTSSDVAIGVVFGRRDRGSSASKPPSR